MQRILEPELMEEREQAKAYSEADFSEPHNRFVELFDQMFPGAPQEGFVLDLGCGPADISCRFARKHPDIVVHGIDGSEAMLYWGRQRIEREDLGRRVSLYQILLPSGGLPRPQYQAVISNSLLHHLAEPRILWETLKGYAAQKAPIFIMDLMRPASRQQAEQLTKQHAGGEPEVLRRDYFNSLLAAFTLAEVRQQIDSAGLSGLTAKAISDRHLVAYGRL